MSNPIDYGADEGKQCALVELCEIGACIGPYSDTCIHVQMTPPYGHVPIGDGELPRVIDCVNVLGNVHGLDLSETAITDAIAHHLAGLKNVSFLGLAETAITDRTVPFLGAVGGLKELVLSGTRITDSVIDLLAGMSALTFLQLYGTQMTPIGVARLKVKLPGVVEA